jgi:hypothetical protein
MKEGASRLMPTVLSRYGFDIRIYTDDHHPPHVHVVIADEEFIINLGGEMGSLEIREVYMNRADVRRAVEIVEEHRLFLLGKWRDIYGSQNVRRAI